MEAWNAIAVPAGCASVRDLTDARRKKLRTRLRDPERTIGWWRSYFARIASSAFLRGEVKAWAATFDWAIDSDTTIARVLEGAYDGRAQRAPERTENATQFALRLAREERAREEARAQSDGGQLRLAAKVDRYTARAPPEPVGTIDPFGDHEEATA